MRGSIYKEMYKIDFENSDSVYRKSRRLKCCVSLGMKRLQEGAIIRWDEDTLSSVMGTTWEEVG